MDTWKWCLKGEDVERHRAEAASIRMFSNTHKGADERESLNSREPGVRQILPHVTP